LIKEPRVWANQSVAARDACDNADTADRHKGEDASSHPGQAEIQLRGRRIQKPLYDLLAPITPEQGSLRCHSHPMAICSSIWKAIRTRWVMGPKYLIG
jgi:hypothetical protein